MYIIARLANICQAITIKSQIHNIPRLLSNLSSGCCNYITPHQSLRDSFSPRISHCENGKSLYKPSPQRRMWICNANSDEGKFSIVLRFHFKIALSMIAHRASLRCFLTNFHMTADTANPHCFLALFKYLSHFHIL